MVVLYNRGSVMDETKLVAEYCDFCRSIRMFEVLTIYTLPDESDVWERHKCLKCHNEFFIHLKGGKDVEN